MVRVATPTRSTYVRAWEIVLSSLLLPLPLILGTTIGALASSASPTVSINDDPSYFGVLLAFAVAFLALQIVVMVVLVVGEYRNQRAYWSMPVPMSIVVAQVVAGLSAFVLNDSAEHRNAELSGSLS